jgi:hypothetical protein
LPGVLRGGKIAPDSSGAVLLVELPARLGRLLEWRLLVSGSERRMPPIARLLGVLTLASSMAGASPCFKLPKGFTPEPPGKSTVVLVATTPTPLTYLPLADSRELSSQELQEMSDELAALLVLGLKSLGFEAEAIPVGNVDALVYRSKGRICSTPKEVAPIRSQMSDSAMQASSDTALAVRLMAHRQQYVGPNTALVDKEGRRPLLFTASGEAHLVDRDGRQLNYFLILDSRGLKPVGGNEFQMLSRSEWLAEIAGQVLRRFDISAATR